MKPESRGCVRQAPAFLDPLPFLSFPSHIISITLVKSGVGGGWSGPPPAGTGRIHHAPNIYFKITYTQNTPTFPFLRLRSDYLQLSLSLF